MDFNISSKVEQRGILAGMLLGRSGRDGQNFFLQDRQDRQEYLQFKGQLLEQITHKPVGSRQWTKNQGERFIRLQPRLIPLIRVLVHKLYPGGQKQVSPDFLKLLTAQGLALWFMDRGRKRYRRCNSQVRGLEISLDARVSHAESDAIAHYFAEVWGFRWGVSRYRGKYGLRMGTREGQRFLHFIDPYVHSSMLYPGAAFERKRD